MPIHKAKLGIVIALVSVHTVCSGLQVQLTLSKDIKDIICIKGLLLKEKFQLIGTVTGVDRNEIEGGQIYIKIKNKMNETVEDILKLLDMKDCNQTANETFICTINIDKKEIIATYTESAINEFNNVSFFLGVLYNNSVYNSSTIELPRIYDPEKIKGFLNDQELSKNGTEIIVKNSTLHFCFYDAPEPLEVSIYNGESLVGRNQTSLILYNVDIKNNDYNFRYKVCNSDTIITYSPILIEEILTHDADSGHFEKCKKDEYVIGTVVIAVLFILENIVLVIFCFRKCRKECNKKFCCCFKTNAPPSDAVLTGFGEINDNVELPGQGEQDPLHETQQ